MKIIDLLNKIANSEEVPKKIKFNDYEYQYHDKEHGYCRSGYDCIYICLNSEYYLFDILNDEVEIIEEEKKIPKKINWKPKESMAGQLTQKEQIEVIARRTEKLKKEFNNLIDYLKSKGE